MLLSSAGTTKWINAWIFAGLHLFFHIIYISVLLKIDPELLNRRGKVQKNTKKFDILFYIIYAPIVLITLAVSGLDAVRFKWSSIPFAVSMLSAAIIYIPVFFFVIWAMMVNTHFETTIRIQSDRNHKVCTSGPYKIVRHPGYFSMILGVLGIPLVLGSCWGFMPTSILILLIVIRTALEDHTLQNELQGYTEYTELTRYRLLPFIW